MSFGETITNLRKNKGITQEQMAERLGVTRQTVSKWELDQSTPDLNYISQLSDIFEVTTDYLIKGETTASSEKVAEEKQIIYIERTEPATKNVLTPRSLAGVIVAILGGIATFLGLVDESGDGTLLVILGIVVVIVGLELVMVKKHPVLVVLWTIWLIVFLVLSFFMVNAVGSSFFNLQTVAGIVTTTHMVYTVVLIIATVMVCKRKKSN